MSNESDTSVPPPTEPALEGFEEFVEIGRGGFGAVYRATDRTLNRTVAIKVLGAALDETNQRRFDRERKALGSLSGHPNIVTIHGSGLLSDGRPYILMEYLSGGSLATRLDAGPLPWREAVAVAAKVAGALEHAHAGGVLHRDIKPENILMSEFGEPKLGDFGIARVTGSTVTRAGRVSASVAHAPPEILNGDPAVEASDVYSLGSTLFTLLAGAPAFVRDTDESLVPLLARIAREPVPDLRSRGVPSQVCAVVEEAMSKHADERIPTAAALRQRLATAVDTTEPVSEQLPPVAVAAPDAQPEPAPERSVDDTGGPAEAPPAPVPARPDASRRARRARGLVAAAALIGAAVVVGGAIIVLGGGDGGSGGRSGRVTFLSLEPGECWNDVADPDDVRIVDCDRLHDAETVATIEHESVSFPGENALESFAANRCNQRLERYAPDAPFNIDVTWGYPTAAGWEAGKRAVICSAVDSDGAKLEGSVAGY